jgi:hypothetical protein
MFSSRLQPPTKAISEEKMDEIIDSILQGKYSSACLVLLEEAGYDPLHYIPYRTYNRLQKQRQQEICARKAALRSSPCPAAPPAAVPLRKRMADLDYIEVLPESTETALEKSPTGGTWSLRTTFSERFSKSCQNGINSQKAIDILNSVPLFRTPGNDKWISRILTI